MNLYLLHQTELTRGAGFYTKCVVVAESIEKAKKIYPSDQHRWNGTDPYHPWESKSFIDWRHNRDWDNLTEPTYFERSDEWANDLNKVEVTLLGKAEPNVKQRVIIASYYSYE